MTEPDETAGDDFAGEDRTAEMLDALARGDKNTANRINAEIVGQWSEDGEDADAEDVVRFVPEPMPAESEFLTKIKNARGHGVIEAWGENVSENLAYVRDASSHFRQLPGMLDFLAEPTESGRALGDDPDTIAVAADYGRVLNARNEGWNADAEPPSVPDDVVSNAGQVFAATGGEGFVREMGGEGTPMFRRNLGYAAAARDHLAKTYSGKRVLAKLMRPDPRNPDLHIGDRPEIARAAVDFGRLLVHARRASRPEKGNRNVTPQTRTAAPKADVDTLIEQKMNALQRGDRIKANRLESQINAHFSKHAGEPIVGQGGRYA